MGDGVKRFPTAAMHVSGDKPLVNIRPCTRCGEAHKGLLSKRFNIPVLGKWTHWATCPTSGDPILLQEQEPHWEAVYVAGGPEVQP